MYYKSLITAFCLLLVRNRSEVQAKNTYTAAVVTLPGIENLAISSRELVANNVNIYEKYIAEAGKKKVDILVFPEATLNYYGMLDKTSAKANAIELPSVKDRVSPCDKKEHHWVLVALCTAVRSAKVYTLVNVVEKVDCVEFKNDCGGSDTDINLFNTNIVFDRNGVIIARYRKQNLFTEEMMDPPRQTEIEPFSTDFGETFFSVICFDLIFKTPTTDVIRKHGVKNIILSTMWFSKAPFLVAPQAQMGFSVASGINLIAACGIWLDHGAGGSGIYSDSGYLQLHIDDHRDFQGTMLISELPKAKNLKYQNVRGNLLGTKKKGKKEPTFENKLVNMNFTQHPFPITNVELVPIKEKHSFCTFTDKSVKHCCSYETKFTKHKLQKGQTGYSYYFASFAGVRKFGSKAYQRKLGEFYCAVVACIGNNPKHDCGQRFEKNKKVLHKTVDFQSIKVTSSITSRTETPKDILVMPSTLNFNFLPLQLNEYQFTTTEPRNRQKTDEIITQNMDDIYSFGLYGRNFNDDDERIVFSERKKMLPERRNSHDDGKRKGDDKNKLLSGRRNSYDDGKRRADERKRISGNRANRRN